MKLNYARQDILNATQLAQNVASPRAVLPMLSNLLIEAKEGKVFITATDLEMSVRCTVNATIEKEGAVTINSRRFGDIMREIPEGDISLVVNDKNNITIKCKQSSFKLTGLPVEEFPAFPEVKGSDSFTLTGEKLKNMIRKTAFACSVDEVRYSLGGVYVEVSDGTVKFVATDGRRLSVLTTGIDNNGGKGLTALVPVKVMNEANRILDGAEQVEVLIMENQVRFKIDGIILVARLIEGHFPDYQKVIPGKYNERAKVNKEKMLASLRRVSILTSEKSRSVKLKFAGKSISLDSVIPDVGEAHEDIEAEYGGKELVIAFNPDYLIDFLKNVTGEEVYFDLVDSGSACVLRPVGDEDYLYVAMPMKG
jgi:DNA polymerase-3 subunit beta